jgi:hypothetical protein
VISAVVNFDGSERAETSVETGFEDGRITQVRISRK